MGIDLPRSWYPPGDSMGYIATIGPPIPKAPSGVHGLLGLYLGAVRYALMSNGVMNARPGQKPSIATQYWFDPISLIISSMLTPLYFATYPMSVPSIIVGSSGRIVFPYFPTTS